MLEGRIEKVKEIGKREIVFKRRKRDISKEGENQLGSDKRWYRLYQVYTVNVNSQSGGWRILIDQMEIWEKGEVGRERE